MHCELCIVYEDNHIIVVQKRSGDIVQGDKTGDATLADAVKAYIKQRYAKPGAVFLGTVHRLDRPVAGLVVFARTSKALARLNAMFAAGEVHKTYHALVPRQAFLDREPLLSPPDADGWHQVSHWLTRNERQNKAYAHPRQVPGAKHAVLLLRPLRHYDRYTLLEIRLLTGRHHQIRCQLAALGFPIRGDLKYGAPRSLPDGSISLLAHDITFVHPVTHAPLHLVSPDSLAP